MFAIFGIQFGRKTRTNKEGDNDSLLSQGTPLSPLLSCLFGYEAPEDLRFTTQRIHYPAGICKCFFDFIQIDRKTSPILPLFYEM